MTPLECKDKIKVGDWVIINDRNWEPSRRVEGEVGEINKYGFCIWQDTYDRARGMFDPASRGYNYSWWYVSFGDPLVEMEIVERPYETPEENYETPKVEENYKTPKVNEIKKTMQELNQFLKRQLDAKTRKLYKAGLINGQLELTEEGRRELEAILYFAYRDELVKRAEEIIKEEKEKNN